MGRIGHKIGQGSGYLAFAGKKYQESDIRSIDTYLFLHNEIESKLGKHESIPAYAKSSTSTGDKAVICRLKSSLNGIEYSTEFRVYYSFFLKSIPKPSGMLGVASWGFAFFVGVSHMRETISISTVGPETEISPTIMEAARSHNLNLFGPGTNPVPYRKIIPAPGSFNGFLQDLNGFYLEEGSPEI